MLHPPFPQRVITHSSVKGAVSGNLINGCPRGRLVKERLEHLAICRAVAGDCAKQDVPRFLVYAKVQFLPCSAFRPAVLSDFPFALAVHFGASRVDDNMNWLVANGSDADGDGKRRGANGKSGVIGRFFPAPHLTEDASEKPFRLAERQMEHFPNGESGFNGQVAVELRFASFAGFLSLLPLPQSFVCNPESDAAPVYQTLVVLPPVAHLVLFLLPSAFLRFCWLFHAIMITKAQNY